MTVLKFEPAPGEARNMLQAMENTAETKVLRISEHVPALIAKAEAE